MRRGLVLMLQASPDLDSNQPIDKIIDELEKDPTRGLLWLTQRTVAHAYHHVRPKIASPPLGGTSSNPTFSTSTRHAGFYLQRYTTKLVTYKKLSRFALKRDSSQSL